MQNFDLNSCQTLGECFENGVFLHHHDQTIDNVMIFSNLGYTAKWKEGEFVEFYEFLQNIAHFCEH